MFPYMKELESSHTAKYFNCYGVKLQCNDSSKNSYCNSILHLLINIDRKLAYELFIQIYEYEGKDPILCELKLIFTEITSILEESKSKIDDLLDSNRSAGKIGMRSLKRKDPASKEIDTSSLVKAIENLDYKNCLDPNNNNASNDILNVLLLKYHQLFKDEFKCSFFQFSNDNDCSCEIHNSFGMKYRDLSGENDIESCNNKFCINLDISRVMEQLKKKDLTNYESLSITKGNLFKFYHNLKCGKDILDTESIDKAILIQDFENAYYLTFKLNYPKKIKINYSIQLALFFSMMPQFLSGDEFCFQEPEKEITKSPRGKICAIITQFKDRYYRKTLCPAPP